MTAVACRSRSPVASAVRHWTSWDATEELLPGQGGRDLEQWHQGGRAAPGHEHHSVGSQRTENRNRAHLDCLVTMGSSWPLMCGRGSRSTTPSEWMEQGSPTHEGTKSSKCQELVESERRLLVVVAIETGGNVSASQVFLSWRRRWTRLLARFVLSDVCFTPVTSSSEAMEGVDGPTPDLADLFRWTD